MTLLPPPNDPRLPPAYCGCLCSCHSSPDISHIMPCCYPPVSLSEKDMIKLSEEDIELPAFLRSWYGREPTAEEIRVAERNWRWSTCERISAAEENMTVAEYRALNERRRLDPYCD